MWKKMPFVFINLSEIEHGFSPLQFKTAPYSWIKCTRSKIDLLPRDEQAVHSQLRETGWFATEHLMSCHGMGIVETQTLSHCSPSINLDCAGNVWCLFERSRDEFQISTRHHHVPALARWDGLRLLLCFFYSAFKRSKPVCSRLFLAGE